MPDKTNMVSMLADWWPFGAFIGSVVVAFLTGKERQRFKVDQIGKDVEAQGKRIASLEAQGNSEAVQLAEILTSQKYIVQSLDDIKRSLAGKADK